MTINLPPQIEAKVRARADATGQRPQQVVLEALEAQLSTVGPVKRYEDWSSEFHAWVASHRPIAQPADDTRDSIYGDRGQ